MEKKHKPITVSLDGMKRAELDAIAEKLGLNPKKYTTIAKMKDAIQKKWDKKR